MTDPTIPTEHLLTLSRCTLRAHKDHTDLVPPEGLNKAQTYGLLKVVALFGGVRQPLGEYRFEGARPEHVRRRVETTLLTGMSGATYPASDFDISDDLAEYLVARAGVRPGMSALEPSAGHGAITTVLRHHGLRVLAVEVDPVRAAHHAETAHFALASRPPRPDVTPGELMGVLQFDFLSSHPTDLDVYSPDGFDAVVMVPPFETPGTPYAAMRHVLHACGFLKPHGVLVACLPHGCSYQCDAPTVEFRSRLRSPGVKALFSPLPVALCKGVPVPMVSLVVTVGAERVSLSSEALAP